MMQVFIYILVDPITKQTRYVGKTNNCELRYKAHLNPSLAKKSHKRSWIKSLRERGLKPLFYIIDEVPENEWQYWETYWYWQLKTWGFDLVNHTTCGDGLTLGNETSFKKGNKAKKIVSIDFNGRLTNTYNSIKEAKDATGHRHIHQAIAGRLRSAGKLLWFYEESYLTLTVEEIQECITKANDFSKRGTQATKFKPNTEPWNKGKSYKIPRKTIVNQKT